MAILATELLVRAQLLVHVYLSFVLLDIFERVFLTTLFTFFFLLLAIVIFTRLVPAAQTRLHLLFYTLVNLIMLIMIVETGCKVGVLLKVVVFFKLLLNNILGRVVVTIIDNAVR